MVLASRVIEARINIRADDVTTWLTVLRGELRPAVRDQAYVPRKSTGEVMLGSDKKVPSSAEHGLARRLGGKKKEVCLYLMRSIFELQMAVSANLSSHKGTFREDKRTLKGGYLKLCVNTCVGWTSVSVETSRFISGVTSSSLGVAVFLDFKEPKIYGGEGTGQNSGGPSAPGAVPGSAPVFWGAFSW